MEFEESSSTWNPQLGKHLKKLWKDEAVQTAFEHRQRYYPLNDTTA
jgi:hypothetical protein